MAQWPTGSLPPDSIEPQTIEPQTMTSTIPSGNGTRRSPGASPSPPPTALQLLRQPDIEVAASPDPKKPTSPQLPPLASPPAPAACRLFSVEQTAALAAPLNRAHVQTRSQAGRPLSYLEGWTSIRFGDTVREPGPR